MIKKRRNLIGIIIIMLPAMAISGDVVDFRVIEGDNAQCPAGYDQATAIAAINFKDFACRAIGNFGGARLTEKAVMSGYSGGCNTYSFPVNKPVPSTLCYQVKFKQIEGEVDPEGKIKCPQGMRLATVFEAVVFNKQACAALSNEYNITRLANQGSLSGSGYACAVKGVDKLGKGHSLCLPD